MMDSGQNSITIISFLKQHVRRIVIIACASGLIGYGMSWIIPHTYVSTVMVLPAEQKIPVWDLHLYCPVRFQVV